MRRKGILILAVLAVLAVGVGIASAAAKYSTKIVFLGNNGPSASDQTLFGVLNTNAKCRGARDLGLFKQTTNGFRLLDADLSSFNGAWALRGDVTGAPNLAIKVKKATRKKGKVVCKGDTITLSPAAK